MDRARKGPTILRRLAKAGRRLHLGGAVERITLLYGVPNWRGAKRRFPFAGWWGELFALESSGFFHIAYFNYNDFMQGEDLEVAVQDWDAIPEYSPFVTEEERASAVKPKKRNNPTILRCPYMDKERYKALERELPRFGYRLITDAWESNDYGMLRFARGLETDPYMIDSVRPGCSFGDGSYDSLQPTIYVARDEDGPADVNRCKDFFAMGWVNSDESQKMADDFAQCRGGQPVGDVFFEKYVPYALHRGAPVAWRVSYFDGVPFYKAPVHGDAKELCGMPEPPDEVLSAFGPYMGVFGACDLVLEEAGGWKCARVMDGQYTRVPLGGNGKEYAEAFIKVVAESPHVAESWCLTARVKDENIIGEDHRLVHGTRHFAPGTKVWLHCPNWDGRVGAIGVPRYSEKLVRVVMDLSKLEDFGVEMVRDKEILAGLARPCRPWPFTSLVPMTVGRRNWDASDECREEILRLVEVLEKPASEESTGE